MLDNLFEIISLSGGQRQRRCAESWAFTLDDHVDDEITVCASGAGRLAQIEAQTAC